MSTTYRVEVEGPGGKITYNDVPAFVVDNISVFRRLGIADDVLRRSSSWASCSKDAVASAQRDRVVCERQQGEQNSRLLCVSETTAADQHQMKRTDDPSVGWLDEVREFVSQNPNQFSSPALQVVNDLLCRLYEPVCLYARPGRGDCKRAVGVPQPLPGRHEGPDPRYDLYGKPHGWCWHCWKTELLDRAREKIAQERGTAAAVTVLLEDASMLLDKAMSPFLLFDVSAEGCEHSKSVYARWYVEVRRFLEREPKVAGSRLLQKSRALLLSCAPAVPTRFDRDSLEAFVAEYILWKKEVDGVLELRGGTQETKRQQSNQDQAQADPGSGSALDPVRRDEAQGS